VKKAKKAVIPRVPEGVLHRGIAKLLEAAAPRRVMWWHTPNGEKRDHLTASILKGMGLKPGVPDFLLYDTVTGYLHAIEVKAKDGYLSDAQKGWMERFTSSPTGRYAVARSVDDAVQILLDWWPGETRIVAQLAPGVVQTEVGA
jgi:hypothetical protein